MANKYTAAASSGDYVGIPSEILKVHTNDVLFTAMPVMRYDQFAVVKNDLEVQPGDTISMSKFSNLSRGTSLSESADLETKSMARSKITIQVTEYGNAVGLTAKFMSLSFLDELQNAATLLGRDYAIVTDIMLRNSLFGGTQSYLCAGRAALENLTADDVITLEDVDEVVAILESNNVLKYVDANGEYYVAFIHPQVAKYLKKELIPVKQYAYPESIFKGEVGEYNGVRFIVTSNVPSGAVSNATNPDGSYVDPAYDVTLISGYEYSTGHTLATPLYKTAFFGERAYGWATALPVELREDPGQANFGRKRGIAWYSIQGANKINNENIVIMYSA